MPSTRPESIPLISLANTVAERPSENGSHARGSLVASVTDAVRGGMKRLGFKKLSNHPFFNWFLLQREATDLRAFRVAAESEIETLKAQTLSYSDQLRVQRDYLDTLKVLTEGRGNRATVEVRSTALVGQVHDEVETESDVYASCRWIEGGMSFVPGQVRVCPNCNADGGAPGLVPFPEAALPIADIISLKDIIKLGNRQDAFDPCSQCAYRETKAWPKKSHAFNILCISHATACNLACDYCHTIPEENYLQNPGKVPALYPAIEALIDEGQLAPESIIQWGGGEPTILREFPKLFQLLERHGAYSEVYTSGVKISDVLLEGLRRNTAGVMVSLDAGTAETYLKIKGRPSFDRVVANVRRYASVNSGRTILKMILFEQNLAEVDQFLDIAVDTGVKIVCFDTPLYRDHVDERFIEAAARFCDEAERRNLEWRPGEVGLVFNPEDKIAERVAQYRMDGLCQE